MEFIDFGSLQVTFPDLLSSNVKYFFLPGIKTDLFKSKRKHMRKYCFLAFFAILGLSSCRFLGKRVHGNGVIKTEERPVSAFKQVEANGDIKLFVTQGDLKPVKIEGMKISSDILK